jgi:hypothetical protein
VIHTFHLNPHLHRRRPLDVLGRDGNVVFKRLFRQIDHVAGEERGAELLEVLLVRIKHAIEPGKPVKPVSAAPVSFRSRRIGILGNVGCESHVQLLGAMVGVQNCNEQALSAMMPPIWSHWTVSLTDGNLVDGRNGLNVLSSSDSASNGRLAVLRAVLDALASEEGGAPLARLKYDGLPNGLVNSQQRLRRVLLTALLSRAASRAATTVELEVTLHAGIAN